MCCLLETSLNFVTATFRAYLSARRGSVSSGATNVSRDIEGRAQLLPECCPIQVEASEIFLQPIAIVNRAPAGSRRCE